jgi:small subunit ribosomal protein S20
MFKLKKNKLCDSIMSNLEFILIYMPITKSAKKNIRKSKRRKTENRKRKDNIKLLIKNIEELINDNKKEEAKKLIPVLYKALDKAAKKGTLKKNMVTRKKSRTTKKLESKKSA